MKCKQIRWDLEMSDKEWKDHARGILRSELAKRNVNYVQLSEMLSREGIEESPQNLSNKIARGTFGAVFMLQILNAIGCRELKISIE